MLLSWAASELRSHEFSLLLMAKANTRINPAQFDQIKFVFKILHLFKQAFSGLFLGYQVVDFLSQKVITNAQKNHLSQANQVRCIAH